MKPEYSATKTKHQQLREPERITKENFWPVAMKWIAKNRAGQELAVISPGSPEWSAWRQYFERHLGFLPWVMRECIRGNRQEMTVPMELPQHFDTTFNENPNWHPDISDYHTTPREWRESGQELRERHGGNWGIGA